MADFVESKSLKSLINIKHGFFKRTGGHSTGIYNSLNAGTHSNDDPAIVQDNRNNALKILSKSAELIEIHQTHSNIVHVYKDSDTALDADAIVTNQKNIALSIVTADCAPVLFSDAKTGVIAAAHAGWKGARSGILDNTVKSMCELGAIKNNIIASIGPCIAQCSYEVGPEFFETIANEKYFKKATNKDHYFFDLEMYVYDKLILAGISQIEPLSIDTYDKNNDFFSYRRKTHLGEEDYGRQISIILQH